MPDNRALFRLINEAEASFVDKVQKSARYVLKVKYGD